MKYYIIAGEASGDLHASNLIREIKSKDTDAFIRAWGGDKMEAEGATIVKHYNELAFMGFVEVVANIRAILRNIKFCKQDILNFKPEVLILVDYPGFNIRIAKWAHDQGIKVAYYISPQVWAWKENRVKIIRKVVDKMIVILPFEKPFYEKWSYKVDYVGHPLVEVIKKFREENTAIQDDLKGNIIALLPGSRRQEISKKLPIMLTQAKHFKDYRFIVAMAPGLPSSFYDTFLQPYSNVGAVQGRTYELLSVARAALVTSGTATLETALFGVPQVICYKGSPVSYHIAKRLIKIRFIGLVNLIMDKEVVKELIQEELNEQNLKLELHKLLEDEATISRVIKDYADLNELLGKEGNASGKAAEIIIELGNKTTLQQT